MPQFVPNMNISDCWSSVGNITFYHRNGKCYWRFKQYSVFTGTTLQLEHQQVHLRALAAWRTLHQQIQRQWSEYAKTVTAHRPPFLHENHISGHNLFVSAYHGFATLGNEHIPIAQPFESFPQFIANFVSSEVINGTDLLLHFSLCLGGTEVPLRYRLLGKIQLCESGKGCHPGKLRNFLSIETTQIPTNTRKITFSIPDYRSVWNLDLQEYTLHIRYLLLDTVTGYRNTFQKLSCSLSL